MDTNFEDIYYKYSRLNDVEKINFMINFFCGVDVLEFQAPLHGDNMDSQENNLELVDIIFDHDFIIIVSNNKIASKLIKERLFKDGLMLYKEINNNIKKNFRLKYKGSNKFCHVFRNLGQNQAICDN